ncbi:MAG: nucleotidyltransferase family protein, partial [Peptococcaceae bacterium]|nr:nucleotidyltransferase family protein [Peptococcaceae bacterium]
MKIAGVICEYNPFHNGHWRQLRWLKEEKGMDAVVCALSGHFTQRGEPAVAGKGQRVKMALDCGADLVLELPAYYATRSAYWFALGGVLLLAAAGAGYLAFGAETDDLPALSATAARLARPDPAYLDALRRFLSAGLPFAEARAKALTADGRRNFAPALPNDCLALAYLQVIAEKGLALRPLLLPRAGADYHAVALPAGGAGPASGLASAAAIRERLRRGAGQYHSRRLTLARLEGLGLAPYMPAAALRHLAGAPLVFPADA